MLTLLLTEYTGNCEADIVTRAYKQTDNTLLRDGSLSWEIGLNFDHKSKQGPYM